MQFDVLRDRELIGRQRRALEAEWTQRTSERGALVRYVMPARDLVLPRLDALIPNSEHRRRYLSDHYLIQTRARHIRMLYPAAEYYRYAIDSMSDQRFSLRLSKQRLHEELARIQDHWVRSREILPSSGQSSFWVAEQAYRLKSEVAASLFFARALMDMFATLTHFLYHPNARRFTSFASYVKYVCQDNEVDAGMRNYIQNNFAWFWRMRDFRDFATHFSPMNVSFYQQAGELRAYMQDEVEPADLVDRAVEGIDGFLDFADGHFASRIAQRQ